MWSTAAAAAAARAAPSNYWYTGSPRIQQAFNADFQCIAFNAIDAAGGIVPTV